MQALGYFRSKKNIVLLQAALSTAALQFSTIIDGGGPPRDDNRIPSGPVDQIPKQTVGSNRIIGNWFCVG